MVGPIRAKSSLLFKESSRGLALGRHLKPVSLYGSWKIKTSFGNLFLPSVNISLFDDHIVFGLPFPLNLLRKTRARRVSEIEYVEIRHLKFGSAISCLIGIRLKSPATIRYYYDTTQLKQWIVNFRKAEVALKFIDCAEVEIE